MAVEQYSRHMIRMARRESGLTQAELAAKAHTSQAAISAYESGRRSPSVDTLVRIVEAAGAEVRMRLAPIDHHDGARRAGEALLEPGALAEFAQAEQERIDRRRGVKAAGA